MKQTINIAYQCSDSFRSPMMVSLYSFLKNNPSFDLRLFIMSKDFSEQSKAMVDGLLEKHGQGPCSIVRIPDFQKEYNVPIDCYNGKWNQDSFCRLFLCDLLPNDIEKVLYLDSDTLICKDLTELWNTDLGHYHAAAVSDFVSAEYCDLVGLEPTDRYYNSGVILFNLKQCRANKYIEQVKSVLRAKNGYVFFVEQSVFNLVDNKGIRCLPLSYNVNSTIVTLSYKRLLLLRKPANSYSEPEINEAIKDPRILHMTSSFVVKNRAWYKNTNYKLKTLFDSYAKDVGGFEYFADNRSAKKRLIDFAIAVFPKSLLCRAVGRYYRSTRIKKYKKYVGLHQQKDIKTSD